MVKLKLSKVSGLLFLDIGLWSVKELKFRNLAILLDTGASVTTISDQILSSLGYTNTGSSVVVTTASGAIKVISKNVDKIQIGTIELDNIDVYAHIFPDECFSYGVLGMNVLSLYNFRVDLDALVIELEPRKTA